MAKSSQLSILYGEGDPDTLASQAAAMQKAGHQVQTVVGRKGVEEALKQGKYELVILGPTLSKNDRHHLPYITKKLHADTRVLVLHTDGERHYAVDANVDTGSSMETVLHKIASLVAPRTAAATAAGR